MEAIKRLDVLTIESLAVGETGLVSIYGLETCVDRGELKIVSITRLDSEPSVYNSAYDITRTTGGQFELIFSKKGKSPDRNSLVRAVLSIVLSPDCKEYIEINIPIYTIKSFLGSASTSQLFDSISKSKTKTPAPQSTKPYPSSNYEVENDWVVHESKSPIDDSPSVIITRQAENGDQNLILRCKENKTDLYINTGDYLGDDSESGIVRFDSKEAQHQKFSLSTDNRAFFFDPSIKNIKTMMKSEKLAVRYWTYSSTSKTVIFKLDGLSEIIGPLREACHW